jgi:hypothetical protein
MLRHIIALSILLMSLLAAGVPAFACGEAVPIQDCCPNGPNAPCGSEHVGTSEGTRPELCCAAGGTIAAATALAAPSNEFDRHLDHADPLVVFVVLSTLISTYVQSPSVDERQIASLPLSCSPLYLSTGRLRL